MKSIAELNAENEKTEVTCSNVMSFESIPITVRWIPFNETLFNSGAKIGSGRGGELLKKSRYFGAESSLDVKCSKTELHGRLYWKYAAKGTIDRIEWEDGVITKY